MDSNNNHARHNNRMDFSMGNFLLASRVKLHEAILDRKLEDVKMYLYHGADPNLDLDKLINPSETERERVAIHRATFTGRYGTTPLTPIHFALEGVVLEHVKSASQAAGTSLQILRKLLDAGANVVLDCPTFVSCIHGRPSTTMEMALRCIQKASDKHQRIALIKAVAMLTEAAKQLSQKQAFETKRKQDQAREQELNYHGHHHSHWVLESMLSSCLEGGSESTTTAAPSTTTDGPLYHNDVRFICPDGQVVLAHRVILATVVPYFKTAFSTKWKESTTQEWKTDKSAHVIRAVLRFIYTGTVDFGTFLKEPPELQQQEQQSENEANNESNDDNRETVETEKNGNAENGNGNGIEQPDTDSNEATNARESACPNKRNCNNHIKILSLYSAAHEFQIEKLLTTCEAKLATMLSTSNLQDILETAALLSATKLKARCFQFMKDNGSILLSDHNINLFAAQNQELWNEFRASFTN